MMKPLEIDITNWIFLLSQCSQDVADVEPMYDLNRKASDCSVEDGMVR